MGNPGNIVVKRNLNDLCVCLYTHWEADKLPFILRTALSHKERWDDCSYLTRIIFCEMVKGYEQEFTGYGISSYFPNQNEKVLYVNCESKSVSNRKNFWAFDIFLDLDDQELNNIWDNEYRNYLENN